MDPREVRGTIFNVQPFSVYDGPGIRTTVFSPKNTGTRSWIAISRRRSRGRKGEPADRGLPGQGHCDCISMLKTIWR